MSRSEIKERKTPVSHVGSKKKIPQRTQKIIIEPSAKVEHGDGQNPSDIDAIINLEIDELANAKNSVSIKALNKFLADLGTMVTQKGDNNTNIVDQCAGRTYAMPIDAKHQLMGYLEACRLEGHATHMSQRQTTAESPFSGIMIDFDIVLRSRNVDINHTHFHRIASVIAAHLQRDLISNYSEDQYSENPTLHIFFTVKTHTAQLKSEDVAHISQEKSSEKKNSNPFYKFGFHVVIPGDRVSRGYKKWLVRALQKDAQIVSVLKDLGAVNADTAIDLNSPSVPVLFLGSCKRGGIPYKLGAVMAVSLTDASTDASMPVVRTMADSELGGFNLVAEMDLVHEAAYEDRAPLVSKRDMTVVPELEARVADLATRTAGQVTEDEITFTDTALSTLAIHDPAARQLHRLLELLPKEYYTDRNKRRDVIFALANSSPLYKPLAEWFSQRFPIRWQNVASDNGREAFEQLWEDGLAGARTRSGPRLTAASITHWAQTANPTRFQEVMMRGFYNVLLQHSFNSGGDLRHAMLAEVLHLMLGSKFCTDWAAADRNRHSSWYEFVVEGQDMQPGEVWKWRLERHPDTLHKYISSRLPTLVDEIEGAFAQRKEEARSETQAKYYADLIKKMRSARCKLYDSTYKEKVIAECAVLFRRRGFADNLDRNGALMGVANGVLELGPRCRLITGFHEHAISRYTPHNFRRFDPKNNAWDARVLKAWEQVIPEPDARLAIAFFIASSLDGKPKESIILLGEGGGSNGKTSLLRSIANALGRYARKLAITLFTSDREAAGAPNSALMALKGARFGYVEELNRAENANEARLKELVNAGVVTGSEKFKEQEDFVITANICLASQYTFTINSRDHGLWRRIWRYIFKIKFTQNPDPESPFERKDDPKYVREYPDDPNYLEAMLSFLAHMYERLHTEYNGQVKNVPSPTIIEETQEYRNSQDALNRFITERVVLSPDTGLEYPMSSVSSQFVEWYARAVKRDQRHVSGEIIKDFNNSAASKYIKTLSNRSQFLFGCRILTDDTMTLRDGEVYFQVASQEEQKAKMPEFKIEEGKEWWEASTSRMKNSDEAVPEKSEESHVGLESKELIDETPKDDWEALNTEDRHIELSRPKAAIDEDGNVGMESSDVDLDSLLSEESNQSARPPVKRKLLFAGPPQAPAKYSSTSHQFTQDDIYD